MKAIKEITAAFNNMKANWKDTETEVKLNALVAALVVLVSLVVLAGSVTWFIISLL